MLIGRFCRRIAVALAIAGIGVGLLAASPAGASPHPGHHLIKPIRTFSVRGYGYPHRHTYRLTLWHRNNITNCREHSYGHPMRRYFHRDPCRAQTRYLYTTRIHDRRVVLEVQSLVTGFLRDDENGARSTGRFVRLERAAGSGGVDDLLREGWSIPHAQRHIPRREVFRVFLEDSGAEVSDAWYVHGRTPVHDHALRMMESQLFLTRATEVRGNY